jgi:hypothetical protein
MRIRQLLAPLEFGHEVDTAAKAHSFVNLSVQPTLGRSFRSVCRKNSAAEGKLAEFYGHSVKGRKKFEYSTVAHKKVSDVYFAYQILQ